MTKKFRLFIAILLGGAMIAFVSVLIVKIFPSADPLHEEKWYYGDIEDIIVKYVREEGYEGGIQVNGWHYLDFDKNIEEDNQGRNDKLYPFSGLTVRAETRNAKYTFNLIVDEAGKLQISDVKKNKNYNPFIKN